MRNDPKVYIKECGSTLVYLINFFLSTILLEDVIRMSERKKTKKKIMVLETIAKMDSGPYRWIDIMKKTLSEGVSQGYMSHIFRELVAQGFLIKQGYLYYINHEKINKYLNEYYKRRPELSK
jgi:hypothetical protein